eukprot:19331-Heterococcus_DN1.PRE.5
MLSNHSALCLEAAVSQDNSSLTWSAVGFSAPRAQSLSVVTTSNAWSGACGSELTGRKYCTVLMSTRPRSLRVVQYSDFGSRATAKSLHNTTFLYYCSSSSQCCKAALASQYTSSGHINYILNRRCTLVAVSARVRVHSTAVLIIAYKLGTSTCQIKVRTLSQ